jgi:SOS-response transcriptional repressor LexA
MKTSFRDEAALFFDYNMRRLAGMETMAELHLGEGLNRIKDRLIRLDHRKYPDIPAEGVVEVVVEGEPYYAKFAKIAINVMRRPAETGNVLPEILRRFFGPHAGLPGSSFYVTFTKMGEQWIMEPEKPPASAKILAFPNRLSLPFFRELRAACGAFKDGKFTGDADSIENIETATSRRKADPQRYFIVQASGTSMDGGRTPIRDGDLVLMEWMTPVSHRDVEGQICLVHRLDVDDSVSYALKRIVRKKGEYFLKSENPPDAMEKVGYDRITVTARFVEVVEGADM